MPFASDAFTDAASTVLTAHTMTLGGPWIKHANFAGNSEISDANRVRSNASTQQVHYPTADSATAEYDVAATLFVKALNTTNAATAVAARIDTGASTMYIGGYSKNNTRWEISKIVTGTQTVLGSYAQTLTDETGYAIKLEIRTAAKKFFVDGVERINVNNEDITATGKAGITFIGTASNTSHYHLDDFEASDPPVTAPFPPWPSPVPLNAVYRM